MLMPLRSVGQSVDFSKKKWWRGKRSYSRTCPTYNSVTIAGQKVASTDLDDRGGSINDIQRF